MKKIMLFFSCWALLASPACAETNCYDAIRAFFDYEEKKRIESELISSIKSKYPQDNLFVQQAEYIAKELSKEAVCTLTEDRTAALIKKVLQSADQLFNRRPEPQRKEHIKFIGKIIKKTCAQLGDP